MKNVNHPTLARRLAAMFYDTILVIGLLLLLWIAFYFTMVAISGHEDIAHDPLTALYWPLSLCCMAAFFIGFWTHGGQTLGMRSWRIRLVAEDGGRVTLTAALVRYLMAIVSALPLGAGYWWSLLDDERRTWHDRVSHTCLVVLEKS